MLMSSCLPSTFSSSQPTDIQQLANAQMLSAQKSQQLIENNNNQPLIDPIQKRRLSRSQENNLIDKNALPMDNHTKSPSDAHYIKNKALQSPVNRYKVRLAFPIFNLCNFIHICSFPFRNENYRNLKRRHNGHN